jgi:glycogen debranching enzyme
VESEERIRIGEKYYLLASALAPRRRTTLLNDSDAFAIFDPAGDIPLTGLETYGLFYRGTRFLERFELRLNQRFPILFDTATHTDGSELITHLANADETRDGEVILERSVISVARRKTLLDGTLYEWLRLHNFGARPLDVDLSLIFAADFLDIFEFRGLNRARRGTHVEPQVDRDRVRLGYVGLDGIRRAAEIVFDGGGWQTSGARADLRLHLEAGASATTEMRVECLIGESPRAVLDLGSALGAVRGRRQMWSRDFPEMATNNDGFNRWLNRSVADITLLRCVGDFGPYIYAGIPWFATVFGRDGLITALETLAFAPALAADVLRTLASLQGREVNAARDEEPGKIPHELRHGEMANLGEIPFKRYYGSVDATPLFVIVLAGYVERTADLALLEDLWPAALAAMKWIEGYGDIDGDGYVEYRRRTPRGLINQGWKDSHDAVSHRDGEPAEAPIALAEVQAYVYAARCGMAGLATRLGRHVEAARWRAQALDLRENFNRDFWIDDEHVYALALDGGKRPCGVVSSNAAHCLFAGIADAGRARQVVERLMRQDMFSGWGMRTLSSEARRYNPMSYHNGSVWPHDNAIAAAGFSHYGATQRAEVLLNAMFDVALSLEDQRLPELFCGFPRSPEQKPVPYPVACRPQAWAAGCTFMLLQAALGMRIEAFERRITFAHATLPASVDRLVIRNLRLRDAGCDLAVTRSQWGASVEVIRCDGAVEVLARK